jgi:hypothetical protein
MVLGPPDKRQQQCGAILYATIELAAALITRCRIERGLDYARCSGKVNEAKALKRNGKPHVVMRRNMCAAVIVAEGRRQNDQA